MVGFSHGRDHQNTRARTTGKPIVQTTFLRAGARLPPVFLSKRPLLIYYFLCQAHIMTFFSASDRPNSSCSHTLPYSVYFTDVRRRAKFSLRSSPFACVSCPFLIPANAFLVRRGPFIQSGGKFFACTKLGTDSTGQSRPLVVRLLFAGHAFCSELVRSSSCTCQFASVDVRWT